MHHTELEFRSEPDRSPDAFVSPGARSPNWNFLALASVVLVDLLARCLYVARPLAYVDNLTLPDDAYLSLTIARNLARGLGPLYGTAYTNGYQPLYVFVMAPVYLVWPTEPFVPVKIALFVLTLFDVATLILLWKLVERCSGGYGARLTAAVLWALGSQVIAHSTNGLETAMASFFVVAVLLALERTRGRALTVRDAAVLGGLCGLGILARVDGSLLAAIVWVVLAIRARRESRPATHLLSTVGTFSGATVAVVVPWLLYSYWYTGLLFPISGRAVRFIALDHAGADGFGVGAAFYANMFDYAALAVFANNVAPIAAAVLFALFVALCAVRSADARVAVAERLRAWAPHLLVPAALAVSLVLAYALYVFGVWFFPRYLHPVTIAVLLGCAALADAAVAAAPVGRASRVTTIAAVVVAVALSAADPRLWRLYRSEDTTSTGYMNIGLWARQTFPPGTRIGSGQTGALGYFGDGLVVYNLDGVVSAECFASLVENRNMDYIREQHIEYVLGWPDNMALIANHSAGVRPTDLEYLGDVQGFRSWGLTWKVYRVRYDAPPEG